MKRYGIWVEDAPVNATGPAVVGTGDDDSTVVVKKKPKVYKRKRRMSKEELEEARNYRKEYDNYHAQPEQRERNAARLRARRQMEKWGKVKKFDDKDVHHKDNNPLNNEEENLKVTSKKWNRTEPRLRKEETLNEKIKYMVYQFKSKRDALAAKQYFDAQQRMEFDVEDDNISNGELRVDAGKNDMTKHHKVVMDRYKPSVVEQEEVGESINIQERELTPTELKRREEIAKDLNDADFKKRYGDRWKEVKMGVATNMAKKESVKEQDDPKADNAKAKELKIAKAIAQAQLAIAKEQEKVQKLTDLQKKIKDQATEETIMGKKYLETKTGSLEEAALGIWQNAAEEVGKLNVKQEGFSSSLIKKAIKIATDMGGDMTGAWKKIEKIKRGLGDDPAVQDALKAANEQKEDAPVAKVDGRTKAYKEALRRIKMRQERKKAKSAPVTEESEEEIKEVATVDYTFTDNKGAKAAMSFARLWKPKARRGDDWDEDEFQTEIFGSKKNQLTVDSGEDGDMENLHKAIMKRYGKQITDHEVVAEETIKEATKYKFPTLSASKDDVANAKKIAAKLKRVYKDVKMKHTSSGAAGGGPGWEISFTDKEDNPKKVLKALQKTGYDDGDMDTDDLEPYAENWKARNTNEGTKEEYKKFFDAALKKFGVDSPADFKSDEEKKKFYDYIDKNWTADHEEEKKK